MLVKSIGERRQPSAGIDLRYWWSVRGRAVSYEFLRPGWDRVLPTRFRRAVARRHGSAASTAMASNSFSMARTSGSELAARHASSRSRSRAESFSLKASARYRERSLAGTRCTNRRASSSGSVNVIFREAILPYYHTIRRFFCGFFRRRS